MKKVLATLGVVGLMVPSAAMAGSLTNSFGSDAMREVGSSVSRTIAEIDNHVYREADFHFDNENWSHNGSINAENIRVGGRGGDMNYGDATVAGGAAIGAEGFIDAEGSYSEGDVVEPVLEETRAKFRRNESLERRTRTFDDVTVGSEGDAEILVIGDGVAGATASGTEEQNGFYGDGHEGYLDGSVAWSVGGSNNWAGGDIYEEVNAYTDVYSDTLATSESYGYASDSYTSFSY